MHEGQTIKLYKHNNPPLIIGIEYGFTIVVAILEVHHCRLRSLKNVILLHTIGQSVNAQSLVELDEFNKIAEIIFLNQVLRKFTFSTFCLNSN